MDRRTFIAGTMAAGSLAMAGQGAAATRDWSGLSPIRYPDPDVLVLDPRFNKYKLGNAAIERVHTGNRWAEGPAWNGAGQFLVWSDVADNVQRRWLADDGRVTTFRNPSNYTNGNTFDFEGRQITFEHGGRRVIRFEHSGAVTVLADRFNGKPFNAPNDGVVTPDGALWFTDPGYGSMVDYEGYTRPLELKEAVYRLDLATGQLRVATDALLKPNGLCFSPDYRTLYVVDTGGDAPKPIYAFDVGSDGRLSRQRVFASMAYNGLGGGSDGVRADVDGNIWAAAGWAGEGFDGVHVFAPDGTRIGAIMLPEICSNLTFGGPRRNRLFMTASQSVYALYVETRGAHIC